MHSWALADCSRLFGAGIEYSKSEFHSLWRSIVAYSATDSIVAAGFLLYPKDQRMARVTGRVGSSATCSAR